MLAPFTLGMLANTPHWSSWLQFPVNRDDSEFYCRRLAACMAKNGISVTQWLCTDQILLSVFAGFLIEDRKMYGLCGLQSGLTLLTEDILYIWNLVRLSRLFDNQLVKYVFRTSWWYYEGVIPFLFVNSSGVEEIVVCISLNAQVHNRRADTICQPPYGVSRSNIKHFLFFSCHSYI